MGGPRLNLAGKRVGKLTILHKSESRKYHWVCKCDCGTTKQIARYNLTSKRPTKTCGCVWKDHVPPNKLPPGQAAINTVFGQYKIRAKERNLNFDLTIEEFKSFIFKDCFYCDGLFSCFLNYHQHETNHFLLKYNGIDRVDPTLGYNIQNCVTCCSVCNYMKTDLTLAEFFKKIELIFKKHLMDTL